MPPNSTGPIRPMLKELRQLWDSLPFKLEFAVLLAAWVALFHLLGNSVIGYVDTRSMFVWLDTIQANAERTDSDDAFGRYVPILVLVLAAVRRRELAEATKRVWQPGLAILALAIVLHAVGFLIQQTRMSIVAFLVGVYGLMGALWGPAWLRAIFFPYFLFVFAVPVASYLDGPTFKLRLFSTWLSTQVCAGLLGMKITRIGTQILFHGTATAPGFRFEVAPACSGIRSITVVTLLTLAFGWLNFAVWWRRGVLALAAIPLALLGNTVRLVLTFIVAEAWGQNAGSWVETKAGLITFSVALGGVFALGRVLREDRAPEPAPEPTPAPEAPKA